MRQVPHLINQLALRLSLMRQLPAVLGLALLGQKFERGERDAFAVQKLQLATLRVVFALVCSLMLIVIIWIK